MGEIWTLLKQAVRQWQQDRAFELAAALSFYAIISLAPAVTMTLSVASLFYGEAAVRGELVSRVEGVVGEPGAEVIQNILATTAESRSGLFAIASFVMLLVGASIVFVQLQSALNAVWNVAPKPTLTFWYTVKLRLLSMGLVLSVGFVLLVSMVLSAVLSAIQDFVTDMSPLAGTLWQSGNFVIGVVVVALMFAALFKLLPDARIAWSDVWVGAFITSLLFNVGRWAIGLYLAHSAAGSAYGATGSLITLLLWIYYSSLVMLLGAEIAQVYARRFGKRISPAPHAIRVSSANLPVDEDGNPIIPEKERAEIKEHAGALPP
ncbi:YihY/virulence factor BrkB family protein [soil metagenome]